MPNATLPISSGLGQAYADQASAKFQSTNEAADAVPKLTKLTDASIALEIVQSLLSTAFPAVVQSDGASQTSSASAPPTLLAAAGVLSGANAVSDAQGASSGAIDLVG